MSSSEDMKVEIEHTQEDKKATVTLSETYGFDKNSTGWQEISIPLSEFSNVDYTKILLPFMITAINIGSQLTFDWDYVRWE